MHLSIGYTPLRYDACAVCGVMYGVSQTRLRTRLKIWKEITTCTVS